jgi:phosphatidate cytidylyltransferase
MPAASEADLLQKSAGLRQRLTTAGLLMPLAVLAVLLLPTHWFAALLGLIQCLGAWEWAAFVGARDKSGRLANTVLVALTLLLLWFFVPRAWDLPLLAVGVLWWLAVAAVLSGIRRIEPKTGLAPALIPIGLVVLALPWLATVRLHGHDPQGPWLVLAMMMLVWMADSAAYFAGRRWGRRKLAPLLSPGKTRVGVYSGVIVAALWGGLVAAMLGMAPGSAVLLVLLSALTAALSVVGDLFESLLKRGRGLKDAGSLLPGHGGVLDRIDSMTAAAPLFAVGLLWLEKGL